MKALAVVAALLLWAVATPAAADQGWYLIVPPRHCRPLDFDKPYESQHPFCNEPGGIIADFSAPLHKWEQFRAYDSARECQNDLYGFRRDEQLFAEARKSTHREKTTGEELLENWARGQCVMASDPRLVSAPTPPPPKVASAPPQPPAPPSVKKPYYGFREYLEALDQEKPGLPKAGGVIHYTPGRPIVVTVRLNGRSSARLVLDTGADRSMIRSRSLIAAGVDLARPVARGKVRGVAGETEVSYFNVDSMEVGSARVRSLKVAAYDIGESASDGLLGRDFLDSFNVSIDPEAGIIRLTPR